MVREDRIKLMVKAAVYEKKEEKDALSVGKYRKKDYVFLQMLKTAIMSAVAALILAALWFFYQPESFLDEMKLHTLLLVLAAVCGLALLLVAAYLMAAYFFYSRKYDRSRDKNRRYGLLLKRLYHLYETEEKTKKPAGGKKSDDEFAGSEGTPENLL